MNARAIICVILLHLLALFALAQNAPRVERPVFPQGFRSSGTAAPVQNPNLSFYATVDRSDGKVYELFVNRTALEGWRRERSLPSGTQFVIESFTAQRGPDGALRRDARGRLLKAVSDLEIHTTEKRQDWAQNGELTARALLGGGQTQGGSWRVGAFDPRDGRAISVNQQECVDCHLERRAEDFVLSRGLLDSFVRSGQPAYIAFDCSEREICFGTP